PASWPARPATNGPPPASRRKRKPPPRSSRRFIDACRARAVVVLRGASLLTTETQRSDRGRRRMTPEISQTKIPASCLRRRKTKLCDLEERPPRHEKKER